MAIEPLSSQDDRSLEDAKDGTVEDLRQEYRRLVWESRKLSKQDKVRGLALLDDPEKGRNANILKVLVSHFAEGERNIEDYDRSYERQIDEEIEAFRFAKKSKARYITWFKELPADKKADYIKDKKTDLHNPRRAELMEIFFGKREMNGVRIPGALRKEFFEEFLNSDLQEREVLIKKLTLEHKRLKGAFLALPEEIQKKYREPFKMIKLDERERLLASLKTLGESDGAGEKNETKERAELKEAFRNQMIEDGVKQNLFSPLSIEPNLIWFKSLKTAKQRQVVHKKQSDLYLRMEERKAVRDEFYGLQEEVRRPHELAFRNADLDLRKEILLGIRSPKKGAEGKNVSYSDDVLRRTLTLTLQSKELQEQLLIHTLLETEYTLGRRAALRTDAVYQEDIAEKTEGAGRKVDDYQELYIVDLQAHRENRQGVRRRLIDKNKMLANQNATETNTKFLNRQRHEVSAREFKNTVVEGQRAELVAHLVDLAAQKLPNADRRAIQHTAEKMDLLIDLHKLAA